MNKRATSLRPFCSVAPTSTHIPTSPASAISRITALEAVLVFILVVPVGIGHFGLGG